MGTWSRPRVVWPSDGPLTSSRSMQLPVAFLFILFCSHLQLMSPCPVGRCSHHTLRMVGTQWVLSSLGAKCGWSLPQAVKYLGSFKECFCSRVRMSLFPYPEFLVGAECGAATRSPALWTPTTPSWTAQRPPTPGA